MATILVLSMAAGAFVAAVDAQDGVATVDADHGLTDRGSIDAFETRGVASTSVAVPALSITVADDHDDAGLDGFRTDFNNRYLRLQYNESLTRTVRLYIPSEYWYPIVAEDREAENSDVTATFSPTPDGRYTAVTVRFTRETDATWAIPRAASFVFWGREESRAVVENATGYEPPQVGSGSAWQYVPDDQLDGNASYPINASDGATVQYDAADGEPEQWLTVPECGGGSAPVCLYEKRGVDDRRFLLSQTADAPTVRFKSGSDLSATGKGALEELGLIPDRVWSDLQGLLSGDLFGGGS